MSKVVARIARSAIISLFLNKFMFSQLGSISMVKRYILHLNFFEKIDFFSEKMKMKNLLFLEAMIFESYEAHRWIPQS